MIWWSWFQFKHLPWKYKLLYLLLFPLVPFINWVGERKMYAGSQGESDKDKSKKQRERDLLDLDDEED